MKMEIKFKFKFKLKLISISFNPINIRIGKNQYYYPEINRIVEDVIKTNLKKKII